jgi:RNA polymerase sigma-70 factor (ECF subfamily)
MQLMVDTACWPQIEGIYRSRFPQLVRVARAITGDRDSAVDAVQEGFADALRSAGQWEGRGPLEGWVWRCVVNRARKYRPPRVPLDDRAAGQNGDDRSNDRELRVRLSALPERQRLVIFLRYYADLEYRQIAVALGIEVGTVSATLSNAHAALRSELEEARR